MMTDRFDSNYGSDLNDEDTPTYRESDSSQ